MKRTRSGQICNAPCATRFTAAARTFQRRAAALAPAAMLALLAACAGTPTVSSYNLVTPPPSQHELGAAIGGRAVPVTVAASPFPGIAPQQLAGLVVAEMPSLCGARFVPAERGGDTALLWSFAATTPDLQADLQLTAPPRGLLSEIQGSVAAVRGPDDPAFAALVRQMTMTLLRPCL